MTTPQTAHRRRIVSGSTIIVALVACVLIAGCSDYSPMPMPDARENPPLSGVFTGSRGEWVILRKTH